MKTDTGTPGWPELELPAYELTIDPQFDIIRPAGDESEESKKIDQLAASIALDGQLHPVSVYGVKGENGKVSYFVYDGRRRFRAITQINEERTRKAQALTPVRVQVNQDITSADDARLLRLAFQSNYPRKGYNDYELSEIVNALRIKHGWEGEQGTKKVVKTLGIDQPRVSIADRVYALSDAVKQQLRAGKITTQIALELTKVNKGEQAQVLEHAADIQHEENAKKGKGQGQGLKVSGMTGDGESINGEYTKEPKAKKAKLSDTSTLPDKIEAPAVTKAIRAANETKDENEIVQVKKNRKEIMETLQEFADSDLSGPEKGLARRFMTALLLNADGLLTDKKLANQWDKVVDAIKLSGVDGDLAAKEEKAKEKEAKEPQPKPEKPVKAAKAAASAPTAESKAAKGKAPKEPAAEPVKAPKPAKTAKSK